MYKTPIAALSQPDWVALPNGKDVTRLPIYDTVTQLFARTDYHDGSEYARTIGARLISVGSVKTIATFGHRIDPVLLPTRDMVAACPRRPGEDKTDYLKRLYAPMGSIEWARTHDGLVRAALLHVSGWDGSKPVMNVGKWWVAGAPIGRSYLMGWHTGTRFIQPEPVIGSLGPHNDRHCDYGTLLMLERDTPKC